MPALDKLLRELEARPDDVGLLQKIGELYQSAGDNLQAARIFARVSETYARDGYFLKAVALFKQVARLDPDFTDVHRRLGELHLQLGLHPEAVAHFIKAQKAYLRAGKRSEALAIQKRMDELGLVDPAPPKARA